ncbi:MAG: hypothetical protein RL336_2064 [Pseudomonadota bacterium]
MALKTVLSIAALSACIMSPLAQSQDHTLDIHSLSDTVHVICGDGGNVTVIKDDKGLLLIDAGLRSKQEELLMTIAEMSDIAIAQLINTHWHYDHVGGNSGLVDQGAVVMAHRNVRDRMMVGGTIAAFGAEIPPAADKELPVITYQDGINLHWGGLGLNVQHFPAGHTDGDSIVFTDDNRLVVMGDIYFHSIYPFIDASSGGSISGVIAAVDKVLSRIDESTIVIPGHGGATATKQDLMDYRHMLSSVQRDLTAMKQADKTLQEVLEAKPTAAFDAVYNDGFLKADTWVKLIYESL